MIRPLVIDDVARAKVQAVYEYAKLPEHWYHVERYKTAGPPPGDDPAYTVDLSTFRCVFSFTKFDNKLYRHLSISVPSEGYPNPVATTEIADMFGFIGEPSDWLMNVNESEHAVVIAQEVDGPIPT